jgi:hypothetical protein
MRPSIHHDISSGFRFLRFGASDQARGTSAVIYLHGAGERGNDLSIVTRFGLPAMLAEGRAVANCDVFCPQLPEDDVWQPEKVAAFIRSVGPAFKNVALVGFSLGASGVCTLLAAYGAIVPFAMAIAGQGPAATPVSQSGVSLLAIQGDLDPWPDTDDFLASVRAAGGRSVKVEIAGKGHFISEEALADLTAVSMLLAIGVQITSVDPDMPATS